jgi:hypothetical protein
MKAIVDGLLPYTGWFGVLVESHHVERHFSRMDRFMSQSYLLDYTSASMRILPPLPKFVAPSMQTHTLFLISKDTSPFSLSPCSSLVSH